MTASRLLPELRTICGTQHVVEEAPQTHRASWDEPALEALYRASDPPPAVVAYPTSAHEVAAILRLANDRDFPIVPRGRHRERFSTLNPDDVVLDTARLNDVEHYDHADLTVGIGAGMTVAQLNAMVGADGLLFALDAPFPAYATIGGVLAAASHGPMRHGYGALRDFCIGIRFVTGDGRKGKGGGRVVKNVAGYDMMKLLIGSYGSLAVITSASFKLFPAPRQTRTFVGRFATWTEALKFRDAVLRSPLSPMCLELASPNARRLMSVNDNFDSWDVYVRASGSDVVLARYRNELGSAVTRELDGEAENNLWRDIADRSHFSRIDLMVPPSGIANVLQQLEMLPKHLELVVLGRVGIGHLAIFTEHPGFGCSDPTDTIINHLSRHIQQEIRFSVSGRRKQWPIAPPGSTSMRAVKMALDPKDILNRGRFLS